MRYAQIRKTDIANGEGIRVSLYVQGCHRHCQNCFNPETWDFSGGQLFDKTTQELLIDLVNRPHIVGITILGGEPLEPENRQDVLVLLKKLREKCKNKTIWLYSSYLYEEIAQFEENILDYLDVLIDGPFVEQFKDLKLRFRGSANQRVIDVKESLKQKEIIIYQGSKYYHNM